MSNFGNIYNKPPIYLVDGIVKEETILSHALQIEAGFEAVGDLVGNIHGLGVDTISEARYINSLASAIGDMSKISPELPFGVQYSSYVENFSYDGKTKEFTLDLIPVTSGPSPLTINAPDNGGLVWNYKASAELLSTDGDYSIDGRVVTFYTSPLNQFSISYNGTYPIPESAVSGYSPNVYPSPLLIESGLMLKPTLTMQSSGRIRVLITQTNINSEGEEFGSNLTIRFNSIIQPFVNSIGSVRCPSEFISAWIKDSGEYRRVDARGIYILSETLFEIDTDELIDLANDIIVLSISNTTIADAIKDMYRTLLDHNHDRSGISTALDHSSLINMIPVSSKSNVVYSKSSVIGNDHPQYFNREGYNNSDPGAFNNAILGDILIGSIDPSSLFNNVDADSNRLVFGSTTEGVSLKYRATERDLYVYSSENGIAIRSRTGAGKQGVALTVDGHQVYNNGQDLTISSTSDKVRISTIDELELGELEAKTLTSEFLTVDDTLFVGNGGSINIGGISIAGELSGITISGPTDLTIESKTHIDDLSGNYILDDNSSISFGNLSSSFKKAAGTTQALFTSQEPLGLNNTGIHTGISIVGSGEFANMYTASPTGASATISEHDAYLELGNGEIFLIRTTREDQVVGNEVFAWKRTETGKTRVDNLQSWPKAGINAGYASVDMVRTLTSTQDERRGVSFGDLNHIYVTGTGTACPSGWMVLESQNGVVLTQSRSNAIDCQTVTYSELTTGDMQAYGSIIAETDISAGGNIRSAGSMFTTNITVSEDLEVEGISRFKDAVVFESATTSLGDALFNTNINVKGGLDVINSITCGSLEVDGIANFLQISNFKSSVTMEKDLAVQSNLRVDGRANFNGKLIVEEINAGPIVATRIEAGDVINANGGIEVRGDINANGNVNVRNILTVESSITTNDTLFADIVAASGVVKSSTGLESEGGLTVKGAASIGISGGKLTVFGDAAFNGDAFSVSGEADIYGDASFHGSFDVSSSATFSSTVIIKGSTNVESDLTVEGTVTSGQMVTNGLANLRLGAIITGLLQTEDIKVDGRIISSGSIQAGRIKADGGIEGSTGTSSSLFDLAVTGSLSQTNGSVTSEFAGEATFSRDVDIAGKLSVNNEISIDNGSILLKNNQIQLTGSTSNVSTQSLEVARIKGDEVGISIPVSIVNQNPSLGGILSGLRFVRISNSFFDDTALFTGAVYATAPMYVSAIRSLSDQDYIDITAKETFYAP